MNKAYALPMAAALAIFALIGCNGTKTEGTSSKSDSSSSVQAPEKGNPAGAGGPTTDNKAEQGGEAKSKPITQADLDSLPAELKHMGYHLYGLSNLKPMKVKMVRDGASGPEVGTTELSLKEIKDGKAIFTVTRTGALASTLGTDTVALSKDGIYYVSTSLGEIEGQPLQMPADIAVGKSWVSKEVMTMEPSGEKVETNNTYKLVGIEKVTVEGGTFDKAYKIEAGGPTKVAGKTTNMTMTTWFVEDVGQVKAVVKIKDSTGKESKITLEMSK